jgi:crotonobetainyl-CoA:carnitine CoA-transferase CaiB-like acyl-CoA transferase
VRARLRPGRGQLVDVAMSDAVAALLTYQAGILQTTGVVPTRLGNRHPSIAPYDTFEAADGTLVLSVGNDEQWRRCCEVLGLSDLAASADYATNAGRVSHYDSLRPILAAVFKRQTRQAWIHALVSVGVPCASVRPLDEVLRDPQLRAREMIQTIDHPSAGPLTLLGVPVKLSDTPGAITAPPPRLGEHTRSVLQSLLGLSRDVLVRLEQQNVIRM